MNRGNPRPRPRGPAHPGHGSAHPAPWPPPARVRAPREPRGDGKVSCLPGRVPLPGAACRAAPRLVPLPRVNNGSRAGIAHPRAGLGRQALPSGGEVVSARMGSARPGGWLGSPGRSQPHTSPALRSRGLGPAGLTLHGPRASSAESVLGLWLAGTSLWGCICAQRGKGLHLSILVALRYCRKTSAKSNGRAPSSFVPADPVWKSPYPASPAVA